MAQTASPETADGSPATKINHFYNGLGQPLSYRFQRDDTGGRVFVATNAGENLRDGRF